MKRWLVILFLLIWPLGLYAADVEPQAYQLYVGAGCQHCAKVEAYLNQNPAPAGVSLEFFDIYADHASAEQFNSEGDRLGVAITDRAIPMLITPDGQAVIGDTAVINYFEKVWFGREAKTSTSAKEPTGCKVGDLNCSTNNKLTWWMLVTAAGADSVNPCEFAILILLMSSMLATGDRKRALWTGIAFIATIFVSYFAMGVGLYSALATFQSTRGIFMGVGILAVLLGLANLKDALWYGKAFLMEVPLKWRPKMKDLIRSISSPWGAVGVALLVSLFLLPCTSGPYIVVLGMLSRSAFNWQALGWLGLYNLIFILPMAVILIATYFGVSVKRAEAWRQDRVRLFHAIAGLLLLGIGIWVLIGL